MKWSFGSAWVFAICAAGCSERASQRPQPVNVALASDEAARVGALSITRRELEQVISVRMNAARVALDDLIRDTLLASAAPPAEAPRTDFARSAVLARQVLLGLKAQSLGPATEEEVQTFTERHWFDLDRPASSRVTHAVVICEGCPQRGEARALAERVAVATRGLSDAAGFRRAAEAVDKGQSKLELKVEDLPPVAPDGRVVDPATPPAPGAPPQRLHLPFAEAANALVNPGDQSAVVETPSGFHVLLLTERLPERRKSKQERSELLTPEIQSARAKALQDGLLAQARQRWSIDVSRSVDQDTELILPSL
ncbi:MAG TPA: peptidylprolyl isomerase [Polyangiaceae bacterium]|jgi:hypothetical protein|nr:peptidylprolyl isomerase [Polyangiaceae bacterium]